MGVVAPLTSGWVVETMASPVRDDNSDADSDLEELQGDIAKFDESVREFLASHEGSGDGHPYGRPSRGGRGSRGPRKAAKPRGDITARLSRVNQAFLTGDYDRALELVSEVIRINAETFQAWTALASIFREQGELDRALAAMMYAAHLRPKDIGGWMSCAAYALNNFGGDEEANMKTARLCFSAALRADPHNREARLGKAAMCHSQGHYSQAILEYNYLLRQRPADLDIVRKLAETCADGKENISNNASAKTAYRRFFDSVIPNGPGDRFEGLWYDIGIYADLCASSGSYRETIKELKALARWMVGRASEHYWDHVQDDDREWDMDSSRRSQCTDFTNSLFSPSRYGESLPLDLRMRLAMLRLRLLDKDEAMRHLNYLDPSTQDTRDFVDEFPAVAYDLAEELMKSAVTDVATNVLEILRETSNAPDSTILLQLGRCYIAAGEQPKAEECFLAAIDADEDSIDARIELANMYEEAKEGEEALILAAEAMALQDARHHQIGLGRTDITGRSTIRQGEVRRRMSQTIQSAANAGINKQLRVPKRYRPKRLAGADTLRQDEQARAIKLTKQYDIVRDLKLRISEGQVNLTGQWMNASRDLVDEFRSLKRFYSWDKYLHFLGKKQVSTSMPSQAPDSELSQMYERLTRSLAPQADSSVAGIHQGMHQGISFDNWLNIFLDYAIGLAIDHQREEAYQVCEAAKDSVVFQASNYEFLIHIAWTVCAIYTNDEERCVTIARHLMRNGVMSDANRMFALLSRLCQSPVSWYTSGPAQKFILRQIRAIDNSYEQLFATKFEPSEAGEATFSRIDMDVCLLMLYDISVGLIVYLRLFLTSKVTGSKESDGQPELGQNGWQDLRMVVANGLSDTQKMPTTAKGQNNVSTILLLLATASGLHATEQTRVTQAETAPRSSSGGSITGTSQCEARTINYITHTLPQLCLTSSWSSTAAVAESTRPFTATEPTPTGHNLTPTVAETGPVEIQDSTMIAQETSESTDTDLIAEPFMSFEDWKNIMLQRTGQNPQDLKQRKGLDVHNDEHQRPQSYTGSDMGDEGEISLNFGGYAEKLDAEDGYDGGGEHPDESSSEAGQTTLHRSKDAGKTCKERFSFASFDAGATILKTNPGAKNSKAILVENKDTYMLLECATPNKYVIIELTDDIWVDTIVLANFEFFSSMIRHFRVSVSDRYPVRMEKWKELGTFEARNSRDIQAFLVENPQIWAKYLRLEFLTHYSNEYYCPVSLVRVHGSRMLDKWKDSEIGPDDDHVGEIDGVAEIGITLQENLSKSGDIKENNNTYANVADMCPAIEATPFPLSSLTCPVDKPPTFMNNSIVANKDINSTQYGIAVDNQTIEPEQRQISATAQESSGHAATSSTTYKDAKSASESSTNSEDEHPSDKAASKGMRSATTETTSSVSPAAATGKIPVASASSSRSRVNGTSIATPSPPTIQEGFFNSVTKRLQQVESNLTLSLKYVEEQSKHVQDAFQRSEQKQILKISSVLAELNQTVLAELRNFRDQYDQIWQSTVLALESQKDQSQRDILALSSRLHVLADEVVFQKRMAIVQAILLLSCLLLVIFSRGVPIPTLGSLSDQGMGTSEAFAEILASMQRRDMYPSGSPVYSLDARTPNTPEPHAASSPERPMASSQLSMDDFGYQRPSPPLTPNTELDGGASDWQTSCHSSAVQVTSYDKGARHISSRKPLPSLPEDVSSPGHC
ncbi:hypothetical protein MY3296_005725 [Beauveria thailandica]